MNLWLISTQPLIVKYLHEIVDDDFVVSVEHFNYLIRNSEVRNCSGKVLAIIGSNVNIDAKEIGAPVKQQRLSGSAVTRRHDKSRGVLILRHNRMLSTLCTLATPLPCPTTKQTIATGKLHYA